MFSFILAALCVAYQMLMHDVSAVASIENALPYLWTWHMVFAILKVFFSVIVIIIVLIAGWKAPDTTGERAATISLILLASPLLAFLMLVNSVLFLGGVYAIDAGLEGGVVVDSGKIVLGSILYGLAVLIQLRSTSSSSKD